MLFWQGGSCMDPVLTSGTFALLGAMLGGLFALRVAHVNRDAQVRLAQEARETQRALANDAARRDWRKQQLSELVANAARRPGLYFRLRLALRANDVATARALGEEISATLPL